MKKFYKYIFIVSAIIPFAANAQQSAKDTILNRQVMLERDYNPTLQDASKINTLPSIYEPTIIQSNAKYQEKSPQILLNKNLLGKVSSGDINTDVDYSQKRGYLMLGAGTNSNLEGAVGYQLVDAPNDVLNIFATHSSTSGDVDYATKDFSDTKAKAKYSDSKINLDYKHTFEPSILSFGAYYRNLNYNYYGNPFWGKTISSIPHAYDMEKRQGVNIFSFSAGLKSKEDNDGILKYDVNAGYTYFKNKYEPEFELDNYKDGAKGGQIDLNANFFTAFDTDKTVGVKGKIMNQSITEPKFTEKFFDDTYHSLTNIEATPYFGITGDNWNISLGVNVGYALDVKNKFVFSPEINMSTTLAEKNKLYLSITGGVNENTFMQILDENRYVNQMARVGYSRTPYDINVGFNSGALTGFEFSIFGGYKQTKDDHLYMAMAGAFRTSGDPGLQYFAYKWGNLSTPLYADVSTGHVGGLIKTSLIPRTDLSAKLTGYFYDVKYVSGYMPTYINDIPTEKKAWGKPTFSAELNADINILPELTISLNYIYAGGRKAYIGNMRYESPTLGSVSMKDISELNIRAEYKVLDWLSIYARANNVLNQKYELIHGYTLQGFNALGGLSFKF